MSHVHNWVKVIRLTPESEAAVRGLLTHFPSELHMDEWSGQYTIRDECWPGSDAGRPKRPKIAVVYKLGSPERELAMARLIKNMPVILEALFSELDFLRAYAKHFEARATGTVTASPAEPPKNGAD